MLDVKRSSPPHAAPTPTAQITAGAGGDGGRTVGRLGQLTHDRLQLLADPIDARSEQIEQSDLPHRNTRRRGEVKQPVETAGHEGFRLPVGERNGLPPQQLVRHFREDALHADVGTGEQHLQQPPERPLSAPPPGPSAEPPPTISPRQSVRPSAARTLGRDFPTAWPRERLHLRRRPPPPHRLPASPPMPACRAFCPVPCSLTLARQSKANCRKPPTVFSQPVRPPLPQTSSASPTGPPPKRKSARKCLSL